LGILNFQPLVCAGGGHRSIAITGRGHPVHIDGPFIRAGKSEIRNPKSEIRSSEMLASCKETIVSFPR
jgi:hypothetical protein